MREFRDEVRSKRDAALAAGETREAEDWAAVLAGHEAEMGQAGVGLEARRRVRSTRRRQEAPALPKRAMRPTTVGRAFTTPDGRILRPSMFITLTLPSYGRVHGGLPVNPETYDYVGAARDSLHFGKLIDRFVQNLRRAAGWNVQYFAVVEPQRRLAPHLHMAIRGTLPRADLRQVIAATYHQVWWPAVNEVRYEGDHLPKWEDGVGYVDRETGEILPTWEEALDTLETDRNAEPRHVMAFGAQADIRGVVAGSRDADLSIKYLAKYLTKSLGEAVAEVAEAADDGARDSARRVHVRRLVEALRWEPCSARCSNWLRFGIQPENAKREMEPGRCPKAAHRAERLGYGGRRVLVSRQWSGKTLGGYQQARRAWVVEALGLEEADADRFVWQKLSATDAQLAPLPERLMRLVADRMAGRARLAASMVAEQGPPGDGGSGVGGAL